MNERKELELFKIIKILMPSGSAKEPVLLCKKYGETLWCQHYGCYEVVEEPTHPSLVLMNLSELLENHHLPVAVHTFVGKKMFRLRNY